MIRSIFCFVLLLFFSRIQNPAKLSAASETTETKGAFGFLDLFGKFQMAPDAPRLVILNTGWRRKSIEFQIENGSFTEAFNVPFEENTNWLRKSKYYSDRNGLFAIWVKEDKVGADPVRISLISNVGKKNFVLEKSERLNDFKLELDPAKILADNEINLRKAINSSKKVRNIRRVKGIKKDSFERKLNYNSKDRSLEQKEIQEDKVVVLTRITISKDFEKNVLEDWRKNSPSYLGKSGDNFFFYRNDQNGKIEPKKNSWHVFYLISPQGFVLRKLHLSVIGDAKSPTDYFREDTVFEVEKGSKHGTSANRSIVTFDEDMVTEMESRSYTYYK